MTIKKSTSQAFSYISLRITSIFASIVLITLTPIIVSAQSDEDKVRNDRYLDYIQKDLKYFGVQSISFRKTGFKYSIASVHKTKADYESRRSPNFAAEIDDKGDIYFRAYSDDCMRLDKLLEIVVEEIGRASCRERVYLAV